jgi:hypothetical protein
LTEYRELKTQRPRALALECSWPWQNLGLAMLT